MLDFALDGGSLGSRAEESSLVAFDAAQAHASIRTDVGALVNHADVSRRDRAHHDAITRPVADRNIARVGRRPSALPGSGWRDAAGRPAPARRDSKEAKLRGREPWESVAWNYCSRPVAQRRSLDVARLGIQGSSAGFAVLVESLRESMTRSQGARPGDLES